MVQKHKMTANFEQLTYNDEMLKNSWEKQLINFKVFKSNKTIDNGMIDFINWILQNSYSQNLYAGSSMYTLLISKPKIGRLNYQQTLEIKFDILTKLYDLKYSDWDTIDSPEDSKNAILWKFKCTGIELSTRFLEFMEWNKNWC